MLDSFSFFLFYSFISNKHKLVCILYQFVYIQRLYHTKKGPEFRTNIERSPPSFFFALFFIKKFFFTKNGTEQTLRFTTIVNKYIFYIYSYKSPHLIPFNNCFRDFLQEPTFGNTQKRRKYKYYYTLL